MAHQSWTPQLVHINITERLRTIATLANQRTEHYSVNIS